MVTTQCLTAPLLYLLTYPKYNMGRIIAIDYGTKRTGIAVTDPLRIIASPLETVATTRAIEFIRSYLAREPVEKIVVGMPKNLQNKTTHATDAVKQFILKLQTVTTIPILSADERFTSKMAFRAMAEGGLKKKARRDKAMVDKLSATLILQSYLYSTEGG